MQTLEIRTRLARRRFSAGFTLIELMVVVVLISVLAVLAAPALRTARDDRLAFDYSRRIQQLIHRGRTRAAGTGGGHLIVAGGGARGRVLLFEGLDNTTTVSVPPGPSPSGGCKGAPGGIAQWSTVSDAWTPTTAATSTARFVEAVDLNSAGVNVDMNLVASFRFGLATAAPPLAATPAWAMCITGNGTTYAAAGATMAAAITAMLAEPPFTSTAEVVVTRQGGVGLTRHVLVTGAGAPRIASR